MLLGFAVLLLVCAAGLAAWFPCIATMLWVLVLETSPEEWLAGLTGGRETIIGVLKAAGIVLALLMALRFGGKTDRYNPGFAFLAMFFAGLLHGLFPGLGVAGSLRSLIGSAAPFMFGFVRPPAQFQRAVVAAVIGGPVFAVLFGLLLWAAGLHGMYSVEQGALRLGASGEAAFLAGYALIAIYAGLMQCLAKPSRSNLAMLVVNFVILVLTGARAPLAFAAVLILFMLLFQRRIYALAAAGAVVCLGLLFAGSLHFIRVVDLLHLGEGASLSNRNLVWPYLIQTIDSSPWFGWGVGAGKVVIPLTSSVSTLIGTNAAHDEYLRVGAEGGFVGLGLLILLMTLWVIRGGRYLPQPQKYLLGGIFIAFALHSATDNTLIASTSSVFFLWVSAIFATPPGERKAGA